MQASFAFMLRHPAHWLSLGFGSGLAPKAPGTAGTLLAWLAFWGLSSVLPTAVWPGLLMASTALGVWACTYTAQQLQSADPGCIVWDEVLAFWIILWVIAPAPWWQQGIAFAVFRFFDAAKPGPVGWADRWLKPKAGQAITWRAGTGILLDDGVAAVLTLLVVGALRWCL